MSVDNPLHLGITATQRGLSNEQRVWLRGHFALSKRVFDVTVHHGDCVGGDEEAHDIALEFNFAIEIHPPTNPKQRAFCEGATVVHEAKDYHARNYDIVMASGVMLGMPEGLASMYPRSGTWSTLRRTIKEGKTFYFCLPDGEVGPT
jgi:hypothetical protein